MEAIMKIKRIKYVYIILYIFLFIISPLNCKAEEKDNVILETGATTYTKTELETLTEDDIKSIEDLKKINSADFIKGIKDAKNIKLNVTAEKIESDTTIKIQLKEYINNSINWIWTTLYSLRIPLCIILILLIIEKIMISKKRRKK